MTPVNMELHVSSVPMKSRIIRDPVHKPLNKLVSKETINLVCSLDCVAPVLTPLQGNGRPLGSAETIVLLGTEF